jgi:hypothetical protein
MLTAHVNTASINALFLPRTIGLMAHPMHDSMRRLLHFVREATRESKRPIADFANIGAALDVSSAVMSNWKQRGISQGGALQAQHLWGCSAIWLLTGQGTPHAELTTEAVRRAAEWQRLGPQAREFFDRTLELAKLNEMTLREPAANYGTEGQPTVPGDLPASSQVYGTTPKKTHRTAQHHKGKRK